MEHYAYTFIPQNQKQLYQIISDTLEQGKSKFDLLKKNVPLDTLVSVLERCLLDIPEVFWLQTMLITQEGLFGTKVSIENIPLSVSKNQMQIQLNKKLQVILSDSELVKCTNDAMRLLFIYKYIQENAEYDYEEANNRVRPISHTAYGSLCSGLSVCDGNAKGAALICKRLGIPYMGISGILEGGEHAWLLVKCDGVWFHMDPTYRYYCNGELDFQNWLRCDSEMEETHQWKRNEYPICNTKNPYISSLSQKEESSIGTIFSKFIENPDTVFSECKNKFFPQSKTKKSTSNLVKPPDNDIEFILIENMLEYQKILRQNLVKVKGELMLRFGWSFGPVNEQSLICLFERIGQDCKSEGFSYIYEIDKNNRNLKISWE